jgi:opacity protein-like surface antigen
MKQILLVFIVCCLSSTAYAGNEFFTREPYAQVQVGLNFANTTSNRDIKPSFRPGYFVSGTCGYQWRYGLQMEFEYAFRRNSMSKIHYFGQDFKIPGAFQSSSYMVNLLWECSLGEYFLCGFQPYLGTGIGYDMQQFHASQSHFRLDKNKGGLAWQVMWGFSYPFCDNSELALEYKYHKGPLCNIFCHTVNLTYTYKFLSKCSERRSVI